MATNGGYGGDRSIYKKIREEMKLSKKQKEEMQKEKERKEKEESEYQSDMNLPDNDANEDSEDDK